MRCSVHSMVLCAVLSATASVRAQTVDTLWPGSPLASKLRIESAPDSIVNRSDPTATVASTTVRELRRIRVDSVAAIVLRSTWRSARDSTVSIQEVTLRADNLMPMALRVQASTDSAAVTIQDGRMTGWVHPAREPRRSLDTLLTIPVFVGGIDWLVPALPLADGYRAVIPTLNIWNGLSGAVTIRVVGSEDVARDGQTFDAWVVEIDRGGTRTRALVSKTLRRTLATTNRLTSGRAAWRESISPLAGYSQPVPSPDGRTVALVGERYGEQHIWLADPDGSNLRQLTRATGRDGFPTWAPDGRTIAFTHWGEDGDADPALQAVDVVSGRVRTIVRGIPGIQSPAWSPNGELIAFSAGSWPQLDLHTVRPDGSGVRRVAALDGPEYWPTWSPDGARFAMTGLRPGASGVYLLNVDGSGLRQLLRSAEAPAWSADGRQIAAQLRIEGRYQVVLIDATTGGVTTLGDGEVPAWLSPDRLMFQQPGIAMEVGVVNRDGSARRILKLPRH